MSSITIKASLGQSLNHIYVPIKEAAKRIVEQASAPLLPSATEGLLLKYSSS